jgi:hypothetical protein
MGKLWTNSELVRSRYPGLSPRVLADLFYRRKLYDARCPVVAGRRLIPADYVEQIDAILRELGYLPGNKPDAAHA